ncbi:MAG: hypothetical protein AB7D02_00995 [Candidatus Paceibacterota bacterium]
MAQENFPTQSLISVKEIRKGVIILKNGSLRSILQVSGINTDLKSIEELNAILSGWRALLNNLDFSMQVIAHSRRVNIEPYLNVLEEKIKNEPNDLLKLQGEDYYNFIKGLVSENKIMTKKFYLVIPYDPVKIEVKNIFSDILKSFKEIFQIRLATFSSETFLTEEEFQQYYQQLLIRQGIVISALNRIGLKAQPLNTKEVISLLFNLYNPETFEKEIISTPQSLID